MSSRVEEIAASVGGEERTSSWIVVDQRLIDAFADVTRDHNFIHVDIERAAQSPMGGTIAHGLLTLSMLPTLASEVFNAANSFKMAVNYGYDKIRFLMPVHSGKRIRSRFKILELTEIRPGEWRRLVAVTVDIEGESKPALVAEWITLHYA